MLKEFKEFAMKGSVVDMAVGIVIGAAFGTIVKSFVSDVLMPPIGLLMGGVDFSNLFMVLKEAAGEDPAVTLNYGAFINTIISFVIIAGAIFMVIKAMNASKKEEAPADPTTKDCPACCSSIAIKATRCPNCTTEMAAA